MKKLYFFLFIVMCIVSTNSNAQKQGQARIDSLLPLLKNHKSDCPLPCIKDSIKVNLLNFLAWDYSNRNPDTAKILSNQALFISKKIGWQKGIGRSYRCMGWCYYNSGEYNQSIEFYNKALDIWRELLDKDKNNKTILLQKAIDLGNIGLVYGDLGEYNKALEYHFQSMRIKEETGDINGLAKDLSNIGIIYKKQGNFLKALDYYFMALKLNEKRGNKESMAKNLGNIGNVFVLQGDYPKALDYLFRSLKINEDLGNKKGAGNQLANIADIYLYQNDLPKSLEYCLKSKKMYEDIGYKYGGADNLSRIGLIYYEQKAYAKSLDNNFKALKIYEEQEDKKGKSSIYGNIGNLYADLGDISKSESSRKSNYTKAFQYYFSALKLDTEIDDKYRLAATLGNIGSLYTLEKKYAHAEKYLKQALTISDSIGALILQKDHHLYFSELYNTMGNFKKALNHYKSARVAQDSLFNEEKTQEITRKEMNYEFDKRETALKAEQEKKEAIAQGELEKQKLLRNSIAGGAGIISLSALLSFIFYKRKRDAEQLQKETALSLQVSETEMKAIRSQMNPHFIFNALQSIQTFLMSHQSEEANTYLLKFSKLMRAVLENSQHREISLQKDMQALELYMQLESIRLPHPFTYAFHIDETIDLEEVTIPPLILQPFVENAIWHGLQYKTEPGHINIYLSKRDNALHAIVEDNGVGRDMSKKVAQPMLLKKESLGMKLTEERLKILNELKKIKAQFKITDLFTKENIPSGTRVELSLPLVA